MGYIRREIENVSLGWYDGDVSVSSEVKTYWMNPVATMTPEPKYLANK